MVHWVYKKIVMAPKMIEKEEEYAGYTKAIVDIGEAIPEPHE